MLHLVKIPSILTQAHKHLSIIPSTFMLIGKIVSLVGKKMGMKSIDTPEYEQKSMMHQYEKQIYMISFSSRIHVCIYEQHTITRN